MPPHRSSYLLILAYIGTSPLISVRPRENNTPGLFSSKKQTHNIILAACIREMRYQQGKQHTSGYRHKIVFLPKHIVCGELDQFILISVFAPLPKASPPPVVVINHQIFYPPSAYSLSHLPTWDMMRKLTQGC